MGWMRTLFMGDIGQNIEIEELQRRLDQMRDARSSAALSQEKQIEVLQDEIDTLSLRLAVLIKLLVSKKVLTAEEIASMIAALEPEDSQ
jgi:hypothetical protein